MQANARDLRKLRIINQATKIMGIVYKVVTNIKRYTNIASNLILNLCLKKPRCS